MSVPPPPPALVVGFDLDLTLLDSAPGVVATLRALGDELGVDFPAEEISRRLGPPTEALLGPYLPADALDAACERYRVLYPSHGITPSEPMPGAVEALAAVRRQHGRTVVATGKYGPNAQLHLDHLGLDVDVLEGDVWGIGKAAVLEREGGSIYVGDHVHDVEGARAAGATSVSVLGGGSSRAELEAAGTDVVLTSLQEFPAWLDAHLLDLRLAALEADLTRRGSVLVAYSGGADSAFLLAAAVRALGPERVVAGTGHSASLPQSERDPAERFARELGVRVLTPATHELDRDGYRANGHDRCFFCKAELLDTLVPLADEHGLAHVATGTNADDAVAGFRPGIRAAHERGAIAPLRDAGLTKEQVRAASRSWGLPTWDKPAAACLSSRIAYGVEVSSARLARVERAETAVRALLAEPATDGVDLEARLIDLRVRDRGDRATVELAARLLPLPPELADAVRTTVLEAGFDAVEIDPSGFRSGSLNEGRPAR